MSVEDRDLLVRTAADVEHIKTRVDSISDEQKSLEGRFDERYVSRHEFGPVQKIVYGMVGGILMAFLVAILAYVIK